MLYILTHARDTHILVAAPGITAVPKNFQNAKTSTRHPQICTTNTSQTMVEATISCQHSQSNFNNTEIYYNYIIIFYYIVIFSQMYHYFFINQSRMKKWTCQTTMATSWMLKFTQHSPKCSVNFILRFQCTPNSYDTKIKTGNKQQVCFLTSTQEHQ